MAKDSAVNQQQTGEISAMRNELTNCENQFKDYITKANTSEGDRVGIFVIKSFNQVMRDARNIPDPKPLWLTIWNEGEICCLFAESGVGKSIYAVQIAAAIAYKQNVLYLDFELTEKQLEVRYSNEQKETYKWPEKLFRVDINPECLDNENYEDSVIKGIEQAAISYECKIIVIDNVTWLCNESEDGELAGKLMKRLMNFKRKYGWSILVLAHTPKRDISKPATQNDLAGSKRYINFFDSAFFIGFSTMGDNYRYIKEIKPSRMGKLTYGANNVITAVIEKSDDGFTHFNAIGYATENEHLLYGKKKIKDSVVTKDSDTKFFETILERNKIYQHKELMDIVKAKYKKSDGSSYCQRACIDYINKATTAGILTKVEDGGRYQKYKLSAKVQS